MRKIIDGSMWFITVPSLFLDPPLRTMPYGNFCIKMLKKEIEKKPT